MRKRSHSDRDRHSPAAGGTPRRDFGIPRIDRASMQCVRSEEPSAKRWNIGAADSDRAGLAPIGDRRVVEFCHVIFECNDFVSGRPTSIVHVDFVGDRDSVQRPNFRSVHHRTVGVVGGLKCFVGHPVYYGVDAWIDLIKSIKAARHCFASRDATGANRVSEFPRLPPPKVIACHRAPTSDLHFKRDLLWKQLLRRQTSLRHALLVAVGQEWLDGRAVAFESIRPRLAVGKQQAMHAFQIVRNPGGRQI